MKKSRLATAATVAVALLTLLYPLVIWLGHDRVQPKTLALLLLALGAVRLLGTTSFVKSGWWVLGALALALLAMGSNTLLPLKLYPVLVNAGLLLLFGYSLIRPPSLVERIARRTAPDLPPEGVRYTRRVTQAWCGFFIANGAMAGATALWASPRIWSLYTGVISYVLMGALFGGEYLVRRHVRAAHGF